MSNLIPNNYKKVIDPINQTVTEYSGTVSYSNDRASFTITFSANQWGQKIGARFRYVSSLTEGIALQRQFSNELNLTTTRPATFIELQIAIPENIQQFIAGFMDGDGSVSSTHSPAEFYQSLNRGIPSILLAIQKYYGGNILQKARKQNAPSTHRTAYTLSLNANLSKILFNDLTNHCILKQPQIELALRFFNECLKEYAVKPIRLSENEIIAREAIETQIKILKKEYCIVEIPYDRITIPYLAGFFDAEGYVGIQHGIVLRALITQSGCPRLLQQINVKFAQSRGKIWQNAQLRLENQTAVDFLLLILPYSIVKKRQIELALEFFSLKTATRSKRHRTEDQQAKLIELDESIKKLKKE